MMTNVNVHDPSMNKILKNMNDNSIITIYHQHILKNNPQTFDSSKSV